MTADDFYRAACARPSDINQHLPVLRMYASMCQHVTEFGVRDVVSTWAFVAGQPTLISYDINHPGEAKIQEVGLYAKLAGTDFKFVHADVLMVAIEPTDLLFIDTYHVGRQMRAELAENAPKVRRFIIMHDTTTYGAFGEDGTTDGLNPAIEEFLASHPGWVEHERFTNNNGLTVLARVHTT